MAAQDIIAQTVAGLGYDLVEVERSAGGLLRITIDLPWQADAPEQFVNVEDCEKVTRQLQFALEVEAVEYRRLEVSSPGIDRPLKTEKDFERFVGQVVDIALKVPIGGAVVGAASAAAKADGIARGGACASEVGHVTVSANRKKFRGTLERASKNADGGEFSQGAWQIVWRDVPAVKPGQKLGKKRALPPLQALGFELSELKEARLAPIVSFKGRGIKDDTPGTDE